MKFLILSAIILLGLGGSITVIDACGGYYASDSDTHILFDPAIVQTGLSPFLLTQESQLYQSDEVRLSAELKESNIREWESYLGEKSGREIIEEIIYDTLETYPHSYSSKAQAILDRNKDLGKYVSYLRSIQPQIRQIDYWDTIHKRDSSLMLQLAAAGEQLLSSTKKEFLKERIAFNIIRLQLYAGNSVMAGLSYDRLFPYQSKSKHSLIWYQAMALKGGVLYRNRQFDSSIYLFSRVFDAVPSLRNMCLINMDWNLMSSDPPKDADAYFYRQEMYKESSRPNAHLLSLCRNDQERAVIDTMIGIRVA